MSNSNLEWFVGEPIEINLEIPDPATGLGHTGATPSLWVRRNSDNTWWDGAAWGATPTDLAPAEVDEVNLPGLYRHTLPPAANAAADIYTARGKVDDATVTFESYEQHVSRVSPLVGLYQVTIQVRDELGAPVPFARASVYDGSNMTPITEGTADAGGDAALSLPALSTYAVRCSAPGYAFSSPATSFELLADGQLVPVTGTALTLPQSPDPAMCAVTGWLRSVGGPLAGARVRVRFKAPQTLGDEQLTRSVEEFVTDALGAWTMTLPRLAIVEVSSPEAKLEWVQRTVADAPSAKWVLLA